VIPERILETPPLADYCEAAAPIPRRLLMGESISRQSNSGVIRERFSYKAIHDTAPHDRSRLMLSYGVGRSAPRSDAL